MQQINSPYQEVEKSKYAETDILSMSHLSRSQMSKSNQGLHNTAVFKGERSIGHEGSKRASPMIFRIDNQSIGEAETPRHPPGQQSPLGQANYMKQTQNQRNKRQDFKPHRKAQKKFGKNVGVGINQDLVAHKEMKVGSDDPIGE